MVCTVYTLIFTKLKIRKLMENKAEAFHGTTILGIRSKNEVVIGGDGQVTLGSSIIKSSANKLRKLAKGDVITGFAGSTADAFTLFQRLEAKIETYPKQLLRACVELAKDWRTDKYLRRLEAMLIVADASSILIVSGQGDVLEPEEGIAAIGSGGNYALAAARALIKHTTNLSTEEIVRESLYTASRICIYTNDHISLESIKR